MGMFDSVFVTCVECNKLTEVQTKIGRCGLYRYHESSVPPIIGEGIIGDNESCENCGANFKITYDGLSEKHRDKRRIKVKAIKVFFDEDGDKIEEDDEWD